MPQPKDTDWLNGYKNKTHLYASYKRLTSELKTHTERERMEKRRSMQIEMKKTKTKTRGSNIHIRQSKL